MGQARKEAKTIDIWKKKKWYQLIAPKSLREVILGETPALEPQFVMGREAKLSLMSVTNDMKKQNVSVSFVVQKVQGDKAFTELKKYELAPSYIKRLVRKGRDRIDGAYTLETLDKVKLVIKPFLITSSNVSSSVRSRMRKILSEELKRKIENLNFSEVCSLLVFGRLQEEIYGMLRKVHPLKNLEVRVLEVVSFEKRTEEMQKPKEDDRKAEQKNKEKEDDDSEENEESEKDSEEESEE